MPRRILRALFARAGYALLAISRRLTLPLTQSGEPTGEQAARFAEWFRVRGDRTLRLDYDLNADSVVFDLGGYEGQWTSDVFSRYCCRIDVFEPVTGFAANIAERFRRNPKIKVHPFGLSHVDGTAWLTLGQDRSSLFQLGDERTEIKLLGASTFLSANNVDHIDLLKINIEGGEYDLLDHLIASGAIIKIRNVQVQFHEFVPHAAKRMRDIQQKLEKTHSLTFQYVFVWENWQLNK